MLFTTMQAAAAMCLWEELCDQNNRRSDASPEWVPQALAIWQAEGSNALRLLCLRIAPAIESLWQSIPASERDAVAFDYEFVPLACAAVDWTGDVAQALVSNARLPFRPVSIRPNALRPDALESVRLGLFKIQARGHAQSIYGYGGLLDDCEDRARDAFKDGESPKDFILRMGEKWGLTTRKDFMSY